MGRVRVLKGVVKRATKRVVATYPGSEISTLTCVYRMKGSIFAHQNHSFPRPCGISCAREAARVPIFCRQSPADNGRLAHVSENRHYFAMVFTVLCTLRLLCDVAAHVTPHSCGPCSRIHPDQCEYDA